MMAHWLAIQNCQNRTAMSMCKIAALHAQGLEVIMYGDSRRDLDLDLSQKCGQAVCGAASYLSMQRLQICGTSTLAISRVLH